MLSMPRAGQNDHRLAAAQQQPEALLLHRRLEAANDGHAGVAHSPGKVIGLQDEVAGAAIGAEEGGQGLSEQPKVATVGRVRRQ